MKSNPAYEIQNASVSGQVLTATINWIVDHEIFKAHFPGKPVVPGALLIDVLSEAVDQYLLPHAVLSSSRVIKFLHVIEPGSRKTVSLHASFKTEGNGLNVQAEIRDESLIFFKFKGYFTMLE